ncbi:hypothetical protein U1Q18_048671, partial [Sarracenia purpurea var. burkii]
MRGTLSTPRGHYVKVTIGPPNRGYTGYYVLWRGKFRQPWQRPAVLWIRSLLLASVCASARISGDVPRSEPAGKVRIDS